MEKDNDTLESSINTKGKAVSLVIEKLLYNSEDVHKTYNDIVDNIHNYGKARELYYNMKNSSSADDEPMAVTEFIENARKSMVYHKAFVTELMRVSINQVETTKNGVKKIIEDNVENFETLEDFEDCIKLIELEFKDSEWINEIRKRLN